MDIDVSWQTTSQYPPLLSGDPHEHLCPLLVHKEQYSQELVPSVTVIHALEVPPLCGVQLSVIGAALQLPSLSPVPPSMESQRGFIDTIGGMVGAKVLGTLNPAEGRVFEPPCPPSEGGVTISEVKSITRRNQSFIAFALKIGLLGRLRISPASSERSRV